MRCGDIYLANLDPAKGSEANKVRPVLVVSNDARNMAVESLQRGVVTVVPLTKNTEQVMSYQVFVPAEVSGLKHDSKLQIEQVRALAFERFLPELTGSLPERYLREIDAALHLHFAL